MSDKLTFRTNGPFRVAAPDGRDLTPPLAKAQGLLLLLLTGTNGARGRAWVQDCLWSDRGQEQAAASMRQTLSVIRRSLGEYRDLLNADRRQIALDLSRIDIDAAGNADFAEGLDVRDAEFDAWLASQRARSCASHDNATRPAPALANDPLPYPIRDRIGIIVRSDGSDLADWTGQVIADGLFLSLSESAHVDIFRSEEESVSKSEPFHILLELNCLPYGHDSVALRLAVLTGQTRRQIWSGQSRARLLDGAPPIDDPNLLQLTNAAVEAVTSDRIHGTAATRGDPADELLRQAIVKIFSMREEQVAEADDLLVAANELRPSPLYLAWRLQIRTIQRLERHTVNEQLLREEGGQLAARILDANSINSMILALLANANLFLFLDPQASLHFGQLAVARNPGNAMAAWALSSARLYNNDIEGAYHYAVHGRHMAMLSPRRFFWDLQQAATAMLLGRSEECISLMRGITLQRPQFRPPMRYLLALEATQGKEELAMEYVRRLETLEPDFSAYRLLRDRHYPASLVHKTSLIIPERVLEIS